MVSMHNILTWSFVQCQLHTWKSFRLFWDQMRYVLSAQMAKTALLLTWQPQSSKMPCWCMSNSVCVSEHDWVVVGQHKLIPSVYAWNYIGCDGLGNKGADGYSGPTYIAISSGEHLSSSAMSYDLDFETLLDLKEFKDITRSGIDRLVKKCFCCNCWWKHGRISTLPKSYKGWHSSLCQTKHWCVVHHISLSWTKRLNEKRHKGWMKKVIRNYNKKLKK